MFGYGRSILLQWMRNDADQRAGKMNSRGRSWTPQYNYSKNLALGVWTKRDS
jgi:hypothetical protein